MNSLYQPLYEDMLKDMQRCLGLPHPEQENVENCYWIARNYWDQLQLHVKDKGWANERMEAIFYREVKPAFACYIEYYSFLAEALQFEPVLASSTTPKEGLIKEEDWLKALASSRCQFWKGELQRGERYYQKHQSFLVYCESGCSEKDEEYFLVRNCTRGEMTQRRPHNRDTELFTVHEEILTTWRAYQQYNEYINRKIHEPAHN